MTKINYLIFEDTQYTKDGEIKHYVNLFLDVTHDEYRYRIPIGCTDKGELYKVFRDVKHDVPCGIYDINFVE